MCVKDTAQQATTPLWTRPTPSCKAFTHPTAANILTRLPLLQQLSNHPEYLRAPMGVGLLPINFPPIIMTCRQRERKGKLNRKQLIRTCFMSVFLDNERPLVTLPVCWGWRKRQTSDTEGWRGKARRKLTSRLPVEDTRRHLDTLTNSLVVKPFKLMLAALIFSSQKKKKPGCLS